MKFPQNVIIDTSKKKINFNNQYWIHRYLLNFKKNNFDFFLFFSMPFNDETNKHKKLLLNKIKKNTKLFTLKTNKDKYKKKINKNYFKFFFKNFTTAKNQSIKMNLNNLFDINFFKKEKIYTKLKYSRVPQYDIVSGGVAAIFAGFLGFLICEKFGFELVDSGDFYFLFMYLVFFFFFSKLFIKLINFEKTNWNVLSFKWFIYFYKNIFILFFKNFKKFI